MTIPRIEVGRNLGAVVRALELPGNTALLQEKMARPLRGTNGMPVVIVYRGLRRPNFGVILDGRFYNLGDFDTPQEELTDTDKKRRANEGKIGDILRNIQKRKILPEGELDRASITVPTGTTDEVGDQFVAIVTLVVVKESKR